MSCLCVHCLSCYDLWKPGPFGVTKRVVRDTETELFQPHCTVSRLMKVKLTSDRTDPASVPFVPWHKQTNKQTNQQLRLTTLRVSDTSTNRGTQQNAISDKYQTATCFDSGVQYPWFACCCNLKDSLRKAPRNI